MRYKKVRNLEKKFFNKKKKIFFKFSFSEKNDFINEAIFKKMKKKKIFL